MQFAADLLDRRGNREKAVTGLRSLAEATEPRRGVTLLGIVSFLTAAITASPTPFMAVPAAALADAKPASSGAGPRSVPSPQKFDPDDPQFAGRFSGQVVGHDGKPLPFARIYVAGFKRDERNRIVPLDGQSKGAGPVRALTDASGRFDFDLPEMTYRDVDGLPARHEGLISASADGYASDWIYLLERTRLASEPRGERIQRNKLVLRLATDDVAIHGRFLAPDGRPLSRARVRVLRLTVPFGRNLDAEIALESKRNLFSSGCGSYDHQLSDPELLPPARGSVRRS
jgi:hypothetical protein